MTFYATKNLENIELLLILDDWERRKLKLLFLTYFVFDIWTKGRNIEKYFVSGAWQKRRKNEWISEAAIILILCKFLLPLILNNLEEKRCKSNKSVFRPKKKKWKFLISKFNEPVRVANSRLINQPNHEDVFSFFLNIFNNKKHKSF